jgi:hypothetical protein
VTATSAWIELAHAASTLLERLTIASGHSRRQTSSPSKSENVATEAKFGPRKGFDWNRLTWGRPDSVPSVLCSYCSAVIPEDDVPLIVSNAKGWTVRFCRKCMKEQWGFAE